MTARLRQYRYELARGGSGGGSAYPFLARFNGELAAPLATPYRADVGTLTVTGTTQTITGGKYAHASDANTWGLNAPTAGALSRVAGRALIYGGLNFAALTTSLDFGFRSSVGLGASLVQGFRIGSGGNPLLLASINAAQTPTLLNTNLSTATDYDFAVVLRATAGAFFLYRLTGAAAWTLLYVDDITTTSTLYHQYKHQGVQGVLDTIAVPPWTWLPTPLVSQASGAFGPTDLGTPNIVASLVCGGTGNQSIIFRRQDASNYWQLRRQATTTVLNEVVAGTPAVRATTSKTATANDRIQLCASGTTIRCWHQTAAGVITALTAYTSASNFSTQGTVAIEDGANAGTFEVFAVSQPGLAA